MATNSTQSASLQGLSPSQAKKRFEDALARLEVALDKKEREMAGIQGLQKSLSNANKKIGVLQEKNSSVASRLDGTIDRLKTILGNS